MYNKRVPRNQNEESSHAIVQEAEESQNRISKLLALLEVGSVENEQILAVKSNVDSLMGNFYDNKIDLDFEMNGLLDNLKKGLTTQEELAGMLQIDKIRSGLVSRMASSLKLQLEQLFTKVIAIFENIYRGKVPHDDIKSLLTDMNFVLSSVDFIAKVVSTPAKTLNSTMNQVENDLKSQVEIILQRVNASTNSSSSTPSRKLKSLTETQPEGVYNFNNGKLGLDLNQYLTRNLGDGSPTTGRTESSVGSVPTKLNNNGNVKSEMMIDATRKMIKQQRNRASIDHSSTLIDRFTQTDISNPPENSRMQKAL